MGRGGGADLRLVDDELAEVAQAEIERRQRPAASGNALARQNRQRHLLSGLIRCGCCGSNYTISGKDYYRCAGHKERGTCDNTVSVRKEPLETATIALLQHGLLTEEHARLFVEEFGREMNRLARNNDRRDEAAGIRLRQVETELASLYQNLLAGLASPAVRAMIEEREAEKLRLEASVGTHAKPLAQILPHPALLELFARKVEALTATLDDVSVRTEATQILSTLIESVTIYPAGEQGPEAEVVAKVSDLIAWATNDNAAPRGGASCSTAVVAGTCTGRCHTSALIEI